MQDIPFNFPIFHWAHIKQWYVVKENLQKTSTFQPSHCSLINQQQWCSIEEKTKDQVLPSRDFSCLETHSVTVESMDWCSELICCVLPQKTTPTKKVFSYITMRRSENTLESPNFRKTWHTSQKNYTEIIKCCFLSKCHVRVVSYFAFLSIYATEKVILVELHFCQPQTMLRDIRSNLTAPCIGKNQCKYCINS